MFIGRPILVVMLFGLMPPLAGSMVVAAGFAPTIGNLGPFAMNALLFVFVGGFLVGTPPMIVAALLVSRAGRGGTIGPALMLYAALVGFALGLASAVLWASVGWIEWKPLIFAALTLAGTASVAGMTIALPTLERLFRHA